MACWPPMVQIHFRCGGSGAVENIVGIDGGLVGPKPVPYRMTISPGLAGREAGDDPKSPVGARNSTWLFGRAICAAMYLALSGEKVKKAGDSGFKITLLVWLLPSALTTMTLTGPVELSAGASTLICVGLTKLI